MERGRTKPEWFLKEEEDEEEEEEEEEPCPDFEVPMPENLNDICVPCEEAGWVPEDCELEPSLPG
jgi:hypothetical protein